MSFNQLSPAEVERLALIAEEAAEVIHAVGKVLRHGYESYGQHGTNRKALEREIGDFRAAVSLAVDAGDLSQSAITTARVKKLTSVDKFLHEQD